MPAPWSASAATTFRLADKSPDRIEEQENGVYPHSARYFLKFSCKHCTEASTMNVYLPGNIETGCHTRSNQPELVHRLWLLRSGLPFSRSASW
jgi:hypothetical protein